LHYQILTPSSSGYWLNSKGKPSSFEIVTGKDKSFLAKGEVNKNIEQLIDFYWLGKVLYMPIRTINALFFSGTNTLNQTQTV